MSSDTNHPKVTAIQNHLNNIDKYIKLKMWPEAVLEIRLCIIEIHPKHRERAMIEEIDKEIKYYALNRSTTAKRQHADLKQFQIIRDFEALSDLCWEKNYFNNDRYGGDIDDDEIEREGEDQFPSVRTT